MEEENVAGDNFFRVNTLERQFYPTDPGGVILVNPPGFMPYLPFPMGIPLIPPWIEPLSPPYSPSYPPIQPPVRPAILPDPLSPHYPHGGPRSNGLRRRRVDDRKQRDTQRNPGRPGRFVKERKGKFVNANVARRVLGRIIGNASEVFDFVEALYDALPDSIKSKNDTIADKVEKLYQHSDKIDLAEAVMNMYNETQMDRGYAKAFDALEKGLNDYGIDVGGLRVGQVGPNLGVGF